MRRSMIFLLISLLTVAALADKQALFPGYTWESPIDFGPTVELAPDAFSATWPAEADYQKAQLEMIVITTPRESVAAMKEAGVAASSVVLSTFLGLTGQPLQINKTLFMGATESRRVYNSSVPRDHSVQIFQKYLENGALVTVAVRVYAQGAPAGEVINSIANTFRADI